MGKELIYWSLLAFERQFFVVRKLRETYLPLGRLDQICGAVAQLGEHQAGSLGVVGSIPTSSTIYKNTRFFYQAHKVDKKL
jgi:hypothetical protein